MYASPNSLKSKSKGDLRVLKQKRLNTLYFGLESGDTQTLALAGKGHTPKEMLTLCQKAQDVGLKMSITAILGLAGLKRSKEHAKATSEWINNLSPRYFSLLTLFQLQNDVYFNSIQPLTNGQILEEALAIVLALHPHRTILRSNHVSNILHLAGSYPKDREKIIQQAKLTLVEVKKHPTWFDQVPVYDNELY